MVDLTLLDQSVAKLVDAAADLPVEDLVALLGAEEIGKTRSSAIASLKELIAMRTVLDEAEEPVEEPEERFLGDTECEALDLDGTFTVVSIDDPRVVHNSVPGSTLHLGDGRKIGYGHYAITTPAIATDIRGRGE